tara:strand:+ start:1098 stop:1376 length:279 start_codon:yes stop_codon:yes gene_type:complete
MNEQNNKGWIENPDNIRKLYRILLVVCALLLAADLLDLMHVFYHKHTHYDVEGWFGFYGIFGFIAYALIVGAGWIWRTIVMRDADYYDNQNQ